MLEEYSFRQASRLQNLPWSPAALVFTSSPEQHELQGTPSQEDRAMTPAKIYDHKIISFINWRVLTIGQPIGRHTYNCIAFPTDCMLPKVVAIPIRRVPNDPVTVDDLDCRLLFPYGWKSVTLRQAPGSSISLSNPVNIIVSIDADTFRNNLSVELAFPGTIWKGNVLVVMWCRNEMHIREMTRADMGVAKILLGLWFQHMER
ncbi:hypothetical protein PLICRDRAFT_171547 [Plicaturopsis crispa FD-325 SS-3]|nr:hypothetical protein PLICRDRAFT_171547 [Plicaturopsis crispa FD-325 SS-3]